MQDRRCKLGLRARFEIARAVQGVEAQHSAARRYAVSPATVNTLWHRWRQASVAERLRGERLWPRRPVPRSCPWALSVEDEQQILTALERTSWRPMRLTEPSGRHRSTIWKVLRPHRCSRRRRIPRPQSTRRYEWSEPVALSHIDAFTLPKFVQPGH